MDKNANLRHWNNWAGAYGESLRATTKCQTIKQIEIEALSRAIRAFGPRGAAPSVLEVGCGNGFNAIGLLHNFPSMKYYGVDFSAKMIESARTLSAQAFEKAATRPAFGTADARELRAPLDVFGDGPAPDKLDVVFTDRMLINLASAEEQLVVMDRIAGVLKPRGVFLMLENSAQSHARLNEIRTHLGLPAREPASYNVFIDERRVIDPFKQRMTLLREDYISGIHDLMLYAVCPSTQGGEIVYDSPLMKTLTESILFLDRIGVPNPEKLGQNVLWVWQKSDVQA